MLRQYSFRPRIQHYTVRLTLPPSAFSLKKSTKLRGVAARISVARNISHAKAQRHKETPQKRGSALRLCVRNIPSMSGILL